MKQAAYLRELQEQLQAHVTPDELKDILNDYESFFADGKQDGKSEEQIASELGSPIFVAHSLVEESGRKQAPTPVTHISNPGRRLCAYFIDAFIAVIPALLLSLFIGAVALPFVMFMWNQSPGAGALSYISYASYVDTNVTVIHYDENGQLISKETTHTSTDSKPRLIVPIMAGLSLAFYLFYALICTLLLRGQTLGKKMMHIQVRSSRSASASKGAILLRELVGKMIFNSIPIVPLISLFTILFTREHRAVHDMLADTIVADL